ATVSRRRTGARPRQRTFLDTGVLIGGAYEAWGPSRTLLVYLQCFADRYRVVLAQEVRDELDAYVESIARRQPPERAHLVAAFIAAWSASPPVEPLPRVTKEQIEEHRGRLMPALRHGNDLPAVVSALLAGPDWVISTNREHWSPRLAGVSGLRIVTPRAFLDR